MRKHFFAVYATTDADGNISWHIDDEVYGLDTNTPVWEYDPETGEAEWVAVTPALSDIDKQMTDNLRNLFGINLSETLDKSEIA